MFPMGMLDYSFPVSVLYHGRDHVSSSYRVDKSNLKQPTRFLFKVTLSGTGLLYQNGKRYEIPQGKALFTKVPGKVIYTTDTKWEFIWLSVIGEWAEKVCPQILARHGSVLTLPKKSRAFEIAREIEQKNKGLLFTSQLESSRFAFEFLFGLLEDLELPIPDQNSQHLEKVLHYIPRHLSKSLSVRELASGVGLTREHFSRLFVKQMGRGPAEYILNQRLGEALKLLANSSLSIREIAGKIGFKQRTVFTRAFIRQFGISPEKWRENPM